MNMTSGSHPSSSQIPAVNTPVASTADFSFFDTCQRRLVVVVSRCFATSSCLNTSGACSASASSMLNSSFFSPLISRRRYFPRILVARGPVVTKRVRSRWRSANWQSPRRGRGPTRRRWARRSRLGRAVRCESGARVRPTPNGCGRAQLCEEGGAKVRLDPEK